MNILPKKRWHVRTKQNIERVRRDEAKAAEEEKELKRRIRLAEQEARTDFLRKKARGSSENTENSKDDSRKEHVNFFDEIEKNGFLSGKNKEHEAEEKAKQEKFEKDLGILTYLGQSSSEYKGETPWYLKNSTKDLILDEKDEVASEKYKTKLDPLNDMKKYLAMKGGKHMEASKSAKEKEIKKLKFIKAESSNKKLSKIEELRAKRMKRELEEKQRSQKFLENLRSCTTTEVILDDRLRKYNSQFNPHLARNNFEKSHKYT